MLYTPSELLNSARIAIGNAQWYKARGNMAGCRAHLDNARFMIETARELHKKLSR